MGEELKGGLNVCVYCGECSPRAPNPVDSSKAKPSISVFRVPGTSTLGDSGPPLPEEPGGSCLVLGVQEANRPIGCIWL